MENEYPGYHEVVSTGKDMAGQIGRWVLDKIIPTGVIEESFNTFVQGVQQESAERTVQMFTQDRLFEE